MLLLLNVLVIYLLFIQSHKIGIISTYLSYYLLSQIMALLFSPRSIYFKSSFNEYLLLVNSPNFDSSINVFEDEVI